MLKNLKPFHLEDGTGRLIPYNGTIRISIKKDNFSRSSEPDTFIKIHSLEEVKYTSLNVKLKDKHVYLLFEEGNNGPEILVRLTFLQNIRFKLMNISIKTFIKMLFYPLKLIKEIFLWLSNKG